MINKGALFYILSIDYLPTIIQENKISTENYMVGKTVLKYKILEEIGEGGMGTVYKAKDEKLGRFVAIKVLSKEVAQDRESRERFFREARAASAASNAHNTTIFEIAKWEGNYLIVMEYLSGRTLENILKDGPLPIDKVLHYILQVAEGLSAAHAKQITHRDIKPGNIMVCDDDNVKIMDFGLAKVSSPLKLTVADSTVGTPWYMSPEQAKGQNVETSSDIFSVGIVLYEMLTGELPFPGDQIHSVLYNIVNNEPKPIDKLKKGLPRGLIDIINLCLKKDPKERYNTINEFIEDIVNVQKTISGGKASYRSSKSLRAYKTRKRMKPVVIILASVFIIGISLVINYLLTSKYDRRLMMMVAPFEDMTESNEFIHYDWALSRAIASNLEQSSLVTLYSMNSLKELVTRDNITLRNKDELWYIGKRMGCDYVVVPTVSRFQEEVIFQLQLFETAHWQMQYSFSQKGKDENDFLTMLDELTDAMLDTLSNKIALERDEEIIPFAALTTTSIEAYHSYLQGEERDDRINPGAAKMCFEQAVALDSTFAIAYARLTHLYFTTGDRELAKKALEKAKKYSNKLKEVERDYIQLIELYKFHNTEDDYYFLAKELVEKYPENLRILDLCGDSFWEYTDFETAKATFKHIQELNPQLLYPYDALGNICLENKEWEKALEYFNICINMDPAESNAYASRANYYFIRGNFDLAVRDIIAAGKLRPEHSHIKYGRLYKVQGKYEEALREFRTALQVQSELRYLANIHSEIANLYFYRKDYDNALRECEIGVNGDHHDPKLVFTKGFVCANMGKINKAKEMVKILKNFENDIDNIIYIPFLNSCIYLKEGNRNNTLIELESACSKLKYYDLKYRYYYKYEIAMMYLDLQETEKAYELFTEIIDVYPRHPRGYYGAALCEYRRNNKKEALGYFNEALILWKNATEELPEIVRTNRIIAMLE